MKILVCYDGSNVAKDALKLAQKHAEKFGGKIIIAKTMPQSVDLMQLDIEKAEHTLKSEIDPLFAKNNKPYETHLIITNLSSAEELVEFANRNSIDEIVIGVKRRSKVGKLFFGSTAQYVILNANCPVVSIR